MPALAVEDADAAEHDVGAASNLPPVQRAANFATYHMKHVSDDEESRYKSDESMAKSSMMSPSVSTRQLTYSSEDIKRLAAEAEKLVLSSARSKYSHHHRRRSLHYHSRSFQESYFLEPESDSSLTESSNFTASTTNSEDDITVSKESVRSPQAEASQSSSSRRRRKRKRRSRRKRRRGQLLATEQPLSGSDDRLNSRSGGGVGNDNGATGFCRRGHRKSSRNSADKAMYWRRSLPADFCDSYYNFAGCDYKDNVKAGAGQQQDREDEATVEDQMISSFASTFLGSGQMSSSRDSAIGLSPTRRHQRRHYNGDAGAKTTFVASSSPGRRQNWLMAANDNIEEMGCDWTMELESEEAGGGRLSDEELSLSGDLLAESDPNIPDALTPARMEDLEEGRMSTISSDSQLWDKEEYLSEYNYEENLDEEGIRALLSIGEDYRDMLGSGQEDEGEEPHEEEVTCIIGDSDSEDLEVAHSRDLTDFQTIRTSLATQETNIANLENLLEICKYKQENETPGSELYEEWQKLESRIRTKLSIWNRLDNLKADMETTKDRLQLFLDTPDAINVVEFSRELHGLKSSIFQLNLNIHEMISEVSEDSPPEEDPSAICINSMDREELEATKTKIIGLYAMWGELSSRYDALRSAASSATLKSDENNAIPAPGASGKGEENVASIRKSPNRRKKIRKKKKAAADNQDPVSDNEAVPTRRSAGRTSSRRTAGGKGKSGAGDDSGFSESVSDLTQRSRTTIRQPPPAAVTQSSVNVHDRQSSNFTPEAPRPRVNGDPALLKTMPYHTPAHLVNGCPTTTAAFPLDASNGVATHPQVAGSLTAAGYWASRVVRTCVYTSCLVGMLVPIVMQVAQPYCCDQFYSYPHWIHFHYVNGPPPI